MSLKTAREAAGRARKLLQDQQDQQDPGEARKEQKARVIHENRNTFETVALDWLAHQSARWEPITMGRIRASLENDIFPTLGSRSMSTLKARDVMEAVKAVETRGAADQAGQVLQRVKAIYRWAVTHERIESNPMLDLVPSEILKPRTVQHRAALAEKELSEFMRRLANYDGSTSIVLGLRMLMLTACPPGEVRGARWAEIDRAAALWTIPAERMKMREEHRVPLSRQALEVLDRMDGISGGRELVFPCPYCPSKPLSENTFNSALARMGYKSIATAHGFRALFSTVANEHGWNPDVIERQLAHREQNEIRAAYHRTTYMADRTKLMQWWADHLGACESR
ncbi:tyrosine-type recombinase/integrase [Acidovorax sp. SUPP950]|uniref:tyrosine-type recombinase/integrase n=1 Tax=Acidovorax sp. SUPP950 TaxID=511901 RepID=UPI0023D09293|nr:tyrosine-type recombinase/integrase [Acidovorax sp. SUPP950]GKS74221.1 tyrosine-type recombinase/integrase [Acidovorax sp. SUPP950]